MLDLSGITERRRYRRRGVSMVVWVPLDQFAYAYLTGDVSEGGMFIRSADILPLGEEIDVLLVHPDVDEGFPLCAKVVRCKEDGPIEEHGMGVEFVDMTPERQVRLANFLNRIHFDENLPASPVL